MNGHLLAALLIGTIAPTVSNAGDRTTSEAGAFVYLDAGTSLQQNDWSPGIGLGFRWQNGFGVELSHQSPGKRELITTTTIVAPPNPPVATYTERYQDNGTADAFQASYSWLSDSGDWRLSLRAGLHRWRYRFAAVPDPISLMPTTVSFTGTDPTVGISADRKLRNGWFVGATIQHYQMKRENRDRVSLRLGYTF